MSRAPPTITRAGASRTTMVRRRRLLADLLPPRAAAVEAAGTYEALKAVQILFHSSQLTYPLGTLTGMASSGAEVVRISSIWS